MILFFKKKEPKNLWGKVIEESKGINANLSILDEDIRLQMKMISLSKRELQIIHSVQPYIQKNIEFLVEKFYQTILEVPALKAIIKEHSSIERLRTTLRDHLIEMFNGNIDQSFLDKRKKVAKIHFRIGLEPKWYMGAFQNLQESILRILTKEIHISEALEVSIVVTKILNFEQQLVLTAYEEENLRAREEANHKVKIELKQQILSISEELVALAEENQAAVENMIKTSDVVNQTVGETSKKSNTAQHLAEKGQHEMKDLLEKINLIFMNTQEMSDLVNKLSESSKEVSDVVKLVEDIAEQTNLLSLNASIESARAGEHGKGFAVVANEVRNLANETKSSIEKIHALVNKSNEYTRSVEGALKNVQSGVEQGKESSGNTDHVFKDIVSSMNDNIEGVHNVEKQIKELVTTIHEIGQATSRVSSSAEQLNDTASNF